jgi:7-cyano-7-deazaguanine synthase in queuosine biosynthesis
MLEKNNELVLVSASGGFDSSVTLWTVKSAGYRNIIAVHFSYGHRGEEAEKIAITNVCRELDIPLKIFDLRGIYKEINSKSMLLDKTAKITTAEFEGLKQTNAWVVGRNMNFMCIMASLAESEVMKHDYDKVYFLGGFLNLSEASVYSDNSEYFMTACLDLFRYGTLIGDRIQPLFGLCNLMKSDQYEIIKQFNLYYFYKHTISCDRPIVENGIPKNCMNKDGIPCCGSGLLSYISSRMVGIDDTKIRNFYVVDDHQKLHEPEILKHGQVKKDIIQIINRIKFPPERLEKIHSLLKFHV